MDFMELINQAPDTEPDRQYYFIELSRKILREKEASLGRKLSFCVTTFGCQMNARDSEKIVGILKQVGFEESEDEHADFVIYNTCTVRENANNKVYGRLGILQSYKKKNPEMMIALCGCMMQEPTVVETLQKSYKFVDLIFGTHNIYKFAELLFNTLNKDKGMLIDIWKDTDKIVENLPIERKYSFKSGVNIMFGCNNFCTYCIVPYVRGRERSRKSEDIIEEITNLVADGVVEVMLLGQNVNSYGKGLEESITFAQLLERICKIDGLKRVRFMTSHPKDLSDELIEVMAKEPKICNHMHLPLQSGSDALLQKMNRHYTKADYLLIVDKLKSKIPDIALTTDIIVGFPGETEEDFLETMDVVSKVKYDSAFTFIYSKRTGTPAALMDNQIEEDVVKDRFDRLLELVQTVGREKTGKYEGTVQEVLIEEVNEQDSTLVTGKMANNTTVHLPGDSSMIGKMYQVKLICCKGFYYIGEII
ncbi:MAG: tRNA (N6-isopentenyl adenosine(37)-C2)-methylthiotransferase MiaB [Pseudobutyrivibrio sp.]|nr:tRNA (N6-isopentenyl adenosine(37)-C2)-methylthiotransferase MiaB [Pseudobutyrivibrio sp.]